MLHPVRLELKNPSEEDSSDSELEHVLEPETDRFGFLLTDGCTDGIRQAGPSPVLVRQREAKWLNIIDQWEQLLHKKTNKIKIQCHKGIPASLRAKCWPLLSGATDRMKQQADLYKLLDSQPALKQWEDVIKRDLDRQFPFHEMFVSKDGHGQRSLFQVLKAYAQFKPEDGYCQAQGPVAAVLLMNMPVEEAFWSLVQICELYLPGYYSPLLEGVLFDAAILTWVLKRSCPAAYKHLQHHGVEPLMFATDWLMCLFTRHLPFNTLLRVWDLFFCYGVRVLLQVAVVMVQRVLGREDQRKRCCGQMETLQMLRSIKNEVMDEEDDFIVQVLSVSLSARDLQRQTEKELQRWRKERPLSTFDPRGRCLGYDMASVKSRQTNEECERKDREKGNLPVNLFRSASTLSLSMPKWQKRVKANSSETTSSVKVVRHRSMGAKEDCRSWANINDKKTESLQDYGSALMIKQKQSDQRLKQETQQSELLEEAEHEQTVVQDVPQITIHLTTELMKEKKHFLSETSASEQISDCKHSPVEDNFTAIQQKERQLPSTSTNIHVQPSVECMRENGLYQVKSLKLLATQAARCHDANGYKNRQLKHVEETQEQNKNMDEDLGELSISGECYFSESITEIKIKESQNESEAQEPIQDPNTSSNEQDNVGTIEIQTHLPNIDKEKFIQSLGNDIQVSIQDITAKETLVPEGTAESQIFTGSQNKTQSCDQTDDSTYNQKTEGTSIVASDGTLNTEINYSVANIMKQGVPESETHQNICETRKNISTLQPIERDFTNTDQQYSYRSSGDFRVRKSSNSRGSRLARRLSEDLFTNPQLIDQRIANYSSQAENDETLQMSLEEAATRKEPQSKPLGFFHRLREDKKKKKQSKPKLQVPQIMIQDFSDDREIEQGVEVKKKVTSKEKRRQRKEQKRKEREDKRQRKKEKEIGKEEKRGQAKDSNVYAQSGNVELHLGGTVSQSRHETPYAEVYF